MTIKLLLFASAREAAGRAHDTFDVPADSTVGVLLAAATDRYGEHFSDVLSVSRVWVNGDESPSGPAHTLSEGDEVAVLPPVSGGA